MPIETFAEFEENCGCQITDIKAQTTIWLGTSEWNLCKFQRGTPLILVWCLPSNKTQV